MAVDGTLWRTPYTPENDAAFGRTANVNIQSECVWSARWKSPAICCLSAVAFDSVSEAGEIDLAAQLLAQPPTTR